ncbi:MAG TPA: hypothetical protein VF824_16035 [Thermoanaerobaculia bacterium]|jgi:hypothetical protein
MRRFALFAFLLGSLMTHAQSRMVHRALNFSAIAPQGWRWSDGDARTAVVLGPRGERFHVLVSAPSSAARADEALLRDLLPSISRAAAASGERIVDFVQTRATAPIMPSVRYAYTRVAANGTRTFVDGYVAAAGAFYSLEYASTSRQSLPEFWSFVQSFRIADKFAAQRSARASELRTLPQSASPRDVLGRPIAPNTGRGPR